MWGSAKRILHEGKRFLLTTHVNPDGDGVGSVVALIELLHHFGKKVTFLCDSPIPKKFQFLNFHNLFQKELPDVDTLIILDTANPKRIGRLADRIPQLTTLVIDHHPPGEPIGDVQVIDPEACSVGAMIYTLFKACGVELEREAAMGIYASVISDTGRFSYSSTGRKAHKVADECLKVGVNPSEMYARLFQSIPQEQIEIFRRALSRMEFYHDKRFVIQSIHLEDYREMLPKQDLSLLQDFDAIHEFNRSIEGVECGAILWEMPDGTVRLSLRSKGSVDIVGPIKALGGGGHPNAAGATLPLPLDQAKESLLNLLFFQKSS